METNVWALVSPRGPAPSLGPRDEGGTKRARVFQRPLGCISRKQPGSRSRIAAAIPFTSLGAVRQAI